MTRQSVEPTTHHLAVGETNEMNTGIAFELIKTSGDNAVVIAELGGSSTEEPTVEGDDHGIVGQKGLCHTKNLELRIED